MNMNMKGRKYEDVKNKNRKLIQNNTWSKLRKTDTAKPVLRGHPCD